MTASRPLPRLLARNLLLPALAVVAIVNTVISLYYYAGVIRAMYIMPAPSTAPLEEPPALQVALGVAGLGTIIVGVYPQPLIDLARSAVLLLKL